MGGGRHGCSDRTFGQERQRRQRKTGFGEKARKVAKADAALHDDRLRDRIQSPDAIEAPEPNGYIIVTDFRALGISVAKRSHLQSGTTRGGDRVADILHAGALDNCPRPIG